MNEEHEKPNVLGVLFIITFLFWMGVALLGALVAYAVWA